MKGTDHSGSTLSAVRVERGKIHVSTIGDSQVRIYHTPSPMVLTFKILVLILSFSAVELRVWARCVTYLLCDVPRARDVTTIDTKDYVT